MMETTTLNVHEQREPEDDFFWVPLYRFAWLMYVAFTQ
jgi:hypothetical protein